MEGAIFCIQDIKNCLLTFFVNYLEAIFQVHLTMPQNRTSNSDDTIIPSIQ